MSEYTDIDCEDDLDAFARELDPIATLRQDLIHRLITVRGSLIFDPDFGLGLENYLSAPLPMTMARDIETELCKDKRVFRARCVITPRDAVGEAISGEYRFTIEVQPTDGFLTLVLESKNGKIATIS